MMKLYTGDRIVLTQRWDVIFGISYQTGSKGTILDETANKGIIFNEIDCGGLGSIQVEMDSLPDVSLGAMLSATLATRNVWYLSRIRFSLIEIQEDFPIPDFEIK